MTFSTIGTITNGGLSKGLDGTAMGITAEQKKLLADSGLEPGSKEYKQMEMQMKLSNLSEAVQTLSAISKKLNTLSEGIIRNYA